MICDICKDEAFLAQKAEAATPDDRGAALIDSAITAYFTKLSL